MIKDTVLFKELEARNEDAFIMNVKEAYEKSKDILSLVGHVFNNYTMHNEKHSLNVMEYMANLITDIKEVTSLDIVLCIYAALFHDIGMVVYKDEIENIKENNDPLIEYDFNVLLDEFGDETLALQEAIRPIHGKRVKNIFERDKTVFEKLFKIPNTDISFGDDLIKICQAHNEDFDWIKRELKEEKTKGRYKTNPQFIALLLRLADLLDIDAQRAPQYLYLLLKPSGISDAEWRQHFILENIEKVSYNSFMNCKEIQFFGQCDDPNIYRKFAGYLDYFKEELARAVSLSENFRNEAYILKINKVPKTVIDTKGFNFADFKLSLDYNAVTSLLMGENIYGDIKYGLRELLQNAIDACKVLNEYYQKHPNPYDEYRPQVSITVDKERKRVSIFDNGYGMSLEILKKYFLNVGVSYYKSKDYRYMGYEYKPIGNYGIGFLACFMLSKNVKVVTKRFNEDKANTITINKDSEYICISSEDIQFNHGTEIVLDYEEFSKTFKTKEDIVTFIKENFIANDVSIFLDYEGGGRKKIRQRHLDTIIEQGISLSKYLNDIEIYVNLRFSKACFFKSLEELTGYNSYFYSEEDYKLHKETETCFDLKDYINDDDRIYLNKLAIIDDSLAEEFNIAFNYLQDYEDTIIKIKPKYITIIDREGGKFGTFIAETGEEIIGNYTYDDFVSDFGQSEYAVACFLYSSQRLIENKKQYLGFNTNVRIREKYFPIQEIYCKDVLVANAYIEIPFILKDFIIDDIVLNSKHKELIPDVTRNNFSNSLNKELSYAIGKALHMWVLDNQDLDESERNLIQKFITKYYSEDNRFYKD